MRLLLDLQCVQSTSAYRGIGRYALSLAKALVDTAEADDQVEVLLNGGDDERRLLSARRALERFLPPGRIHVFDAPWPWEHALDPDVRRDAEQIRAAAVESLRPDALLIGSLFEGDSENVLSVPRDGPPTAAVLYDLIPATDPGTYLMGPGAEQYWRRWKDLERVDLLLAISDHSRRQAAQLVGVACPRTATVWGGAYPSGLFEDFERRDTAAPAAVRTPYLLAVGGDHPRKNLDRLVQAWGLVPAAIRAGTALAVACQLHPGTVRRLRRLARGAGLSSEDLVLTGEVVEEDLARLYREAAAFVFPSTEEGLGLPPLEAMATGCPTILAEGSSLAELVDLPEAYFDGTDLAAITAALVRVLQDSDHVARLRDAAVRTSARFTWRHSGQLAWEALRTLAPRPLPGPLPLPEGGPAAPLVLQEMPTVPTAPPAARKAYEELGLRDADLAWALTPAAALVGGDDVLRDLASAGLLEQPLLHAEQVEFLAAHDIYGALRRRLPRPARPDLLLPALARPPRWTLQRPWPVWLYLTTRSPGLTPSEPDSPLLVTGAPGAAVLAACVDVVLVDAELMERLAGNLRNARCRGTEVVVLGEDGPSWCHRAPDIAAALALALPQSTGWPWGD